MALENKFLVGVRGDGQAIWVRGLGMLSLEDAANLYAYLRLFLELGDDGQRMADAAWRHVNE